MFSRLSPYLIQALVLGFCSAVMPGNGQETLVSQATRYGWRRGATVALSPLLSDGPVILVILLLLGQLPFWFLEALRLLGGLFLIYLAWVAGRSFRLALTSTPDRPSIPRLTLLQMVVVRLLGPEVYVLWATMNGVLLLDSYTYAPEWAMIFLVSFYGCHAMFSLIIVGLLSELAVRPTRSSSALSYVALVTMLILGFAQIWVGARAIMGRFL